jgi:hypothetical protein
MPFWPAHGKEAAMASKSRLRTIASAAARTERFFPGEDLDAPLVSVDVVPHGGTQLLFYSLNHVEPIGNEQPTPELAIGLLTKALTRARKALKAKGGAR